MESLKSIKVGTLLFCLTLFILSCGGEHSHSHDGDGADHTHEQSKEGQGHGDGHDHGTKAAHGESKEYTSAYVCPMHCKDSGSDAEGKCPVCNMDYIAQAEHTKDGHTH